MSEDGAAEPGSRKPLSFNISEISNAVARQFIV